MDERNSVKIYKTPHLNESLAFLKPVF